MCQASAREFSIKENLRLDVRLDRGLWNGLNSSTLRDRLRSMLREWLREMLREWLREWLRDLLWSTIEAHTQCTSNRCLCGPLGHVLEHWAKVFDDRSLSVLFEAKIGDLSSLVQYGAH